MIDTFWRADGGRGVMFLRTLVPVSFGVLVGGLVAVEPRAGLAPAAVAIAVLLARVQWVRLPVIALGAIFALQSSSDLSLTKLAYFGLAAAAAAPAVVSCARLASIPDWSSPLLKATAVLALALAGSLLVSIAHGIDPAWWLRDSLSYWLLLIAGIVAVDAGHAQGRKARSVVEWCFFLAAVGSSVAFAVQWIHRRDLVAFPVDAILLPSFFLPLAALLYVVANGVGRRGRLAIVPVGGLIAIALAASGARLVLSLLPPLAVVAVRTLARSPRQALISGTVAVAALALGLSLASIAFGGPQQLTPYVTRFETIPTLLSAPLADQSFESRALQQETAVELFLDHPLAGLGPGYLYYVTTGPVLPYFTVNLDAPASYLSKFGLVGLAALFALSAVYVSSIRRLPSSPTRLVLAVYLAFGAAWAVLISPPMEDKGFSLGIMFLLALSASSRLAPSGERNDGVTPQLTASPAHPDPRP